MTDSTQPCGHPLSAIGGKGTGNGTTHWCTMCAEESVAQKNMTDEEAINFAPDVFGDSKFQLAALVGLGANIGEYTYGMDYGRESFTVGMVCKTLPDGSMKVLEEFINKDGRWVKREH